MINETLFKASAQTRRCLCSKRRANWKQGLCSSTSNLIITPYTVMHFINRSRSQEAFISYTFETTVFISDTNWNKHIKPEIKEGAIMVIFSTEARNRNRSEGMAPSSSPPTSIKTAWVFLRSHYIWLNTYLCAIFQCMDTWGWVAQPAEPH